MIDLKKQDNVADAVNEILQQEALKGNQHKIDANHNNEVDAEDFKILRGKKKVKEEVEQIDELSINTLTRVKGAATSAASDASREGDEGKATKRYDLAGKASNKIETKNRAAGLKPSGQHAFEEVEQIDIEEGAKETAQKALNLADKLRKKDPEKSKMYRNLGIKASQRSNNPTGVKSGQPHGSGNKALRKQGIEPVPSSISSSKMRGYFEEVEQIDELSKDTLGSYLDKKKSEYMKGKTQSGSKENAKDIQNMGKAHDKKTLKQMKERMEEPILDELIYEVMSQDASAGDYIHDFIHSDNPKFAGKSDAKRKEMALAAYYSKKNEENVNEGLKDMAKKTFKALTGGSDKDHLDRLKKDMYGGSEVKYAAKTLVKHAKDPLGLKKEEAEQIDELSKDTLTSYRVNSIGRSSSFEKRGYEAAKKDGGAGNDKADKLFNKADSVAAARKRAQEKMRKEEVVTEAKGIPVAHGYTMHQKHSGKYRVHSPSGEHVGDVEKEGNMWRYHGSSNPNWPGNESHKDYQTDKVEDKHEAGDIVAHLHHSGMKNESIQEGWDDMVKAAQEKVKSGPKPSGGSGKKEGSRYGGSKQKEKPEQDVKEATDTVEKDSKTGKVKSWMHTGDWKKSTNKDAHGKVTHASDVARRKTEKMSEAKDPNMDAGVGSQPNFVTDSAKPMQHAQSLAKKSLAKMRSDMMAKKSK
jgi:hypothetical protein